MTATEDDPTSSASDKQITFNVKASTDAKYTITVPETTTVLQLKEKLSTEEYANVETGRQRLIYSGRVMKDHEPLSAYNIKDGNTVHMVKGAASNQQRNPASANQTVPNAGVPQNIASGTGHDPLAGLTGARYAGFAQLPGADQFGPDGGIGGDNPDRLLAMLDNPMMASQLNEAMNNPAIIQMMQNSPMIRNNPMLRNMLNNPDFRRMLMDPNFIRQGMALNQAMGRGAGPTEGNMPAPGVTDTTPESQQRQQQQQEGTNQQNTTASGAQQQQQPFNPFSMLGQMPQFNNPSNIPQTNASQNSSSTDNSSQNRSTDPSTGSQQPPFNPFAMFGQLPSQGRQGQDGNNSFQNMMQQMTQQMMQNPEMMRMASEAMAGMGGPGGMGGFGGLGGNLGAGGAGSQGTGGSNQPAFNPFALLGGMDGGMGGFGGPQQQQQQQDSRPPEEQYADQLRQLNDMGFFEFDRNVRALRMSGGRVEGAVELLLSGTL